jgi:CRP-like cAMP-binding protein
MTGAEMKAMLKRAHFATFKRNDYLFRQGETPKKIFFILRGAVRWCYTDESGNEHIVNFAFENRPIVPFGDFEKRTPCDNSAVAMKATYVIWTSRDEFFSFLDEFPKYHPALRKLLTEYVHQESEQTRLLRIASAQERYETLCKCHPEIVGRVPQKYIAAYLGIAESTFSRMKAGR